MANAPDGRAGVNPSVAMSNLPLIVDRLFGFCRVFLVSERKKIEKKLLSLFLYRTKHVKRQAPSGLCAGARRASSVSLHVYVRAANGRAAPGSAD